MNNKLNDQKLTTTDFEQPKRFIKQKLVKKIVWLLIAVILGFNCYYLFKPTSNIERAFSIDAYARITPADYEEIIPKESFIAPATIVQLTVNAEELESISVEIGQPIASGDVLANYRKDTQDELVQQYEIERDAYKSELSNLKGVLTELEMLDSSLSPTSHINSKQVGDDLSVDVQMELVQQQATSPAIAIIKQQIAEVERQIQILNAQIKESAAVKLVTSSVDGSIGNILRENGNVTFVLYSNEKNLVTYVSEDEWKRISEGQSVTLTVEDNTLNGLVTEKQALPATDSPWLERALKDGIVKASDTFYEITIQSSDDALIESPYTEHARAEIIINEFTNSAITPSEWIIENVQDESVEQNFIYTLGYDGRTRIAAISQLQQVDSAALREASIIEEELNEEADETDETHETDKADESDETHETDETETMNLPDKSSIGSKQIKKVLKQLKATDADSTNQDIAIFSGAIDEPTIYVSARPKNIYAYAFLPMPFKTFSFKNVEPIDWKVIIKYLLF